MQLSGYGVMIALGILTAAAVGWFLTRRAGLNFYDFILLSTYTVFLGVLGAKIFYLLQNAALIDWSRIFDLDYFSNLMSGGFVFYGGIPLGLFGFWLAQKLHQIDGRPFLALGLPLLPLVHGFGRIGCSLAGCCYGIPYDGPLAVIYSDKAYGAPAGVPLFPVQLLEAVVEFMIFALLLGLYLRGWRGGRLLPTYLCLYAVVRFGLEYLRYDEARGMFLWFSTSQWVSIFILVVAVAFGIWSWRRQGAIENKGDAA